MIAIRTIGRTSADGEADWRRATAVRRPRRIIRSSGTLPFAVDLEDWDLPHMHGVLGLHRHVVRLVELGDDGNRTSYVVKELPDHLAEREYRLLRGLVEDRLPTVIVVGVVTERSGGRDGLLITRHLDYSLPYRTLLSGRGLSIPYLGDRLLDALVGLLVRLHLAGFFWGDCSLSNTLFRRDAGALQAYIIDVETSERYEQLTDGQRQMDLDIATENVAGGLLDLQMGGRLVERHRPVGDRHQPRGPLPQPVGRAHRRRGDRGRRRCGGSRSACAGCTTSASTSARWRCSPTRTASACASCPASSRAATTRTGCSP